MIRALVRFVLRVLFRIRVEGRFPEPVPERLLIISNHQSFLDPILIGAFVSPDVTWVVHQQIYDRWYFRWFVDLTRHVVVDAGRARGIRGLMREIEQGRAVVVFPEGRITVTGGLMKIYDGPAFLAARTGASILPVVIDGALHTPVGRMQPPFPRRWFPRIRITMRPLEKLEMPAGRSGRERRRRAGDRMRRMMEEALYRSRVRRTIPEALLEAVRIYGKGSAVVDDLRQEGQTYGRLLKGMMALGRLTARLAPEGEVVGVLLPNSGPTVALLLGLMAARRVPAMLNYSVGAEGLRAACTAAEVKTVISSRAFLEHPRLAGLAEQLTGVRLVYLEDLRASFGLADRLWLVFRGKGWLKRAVRRLRPEDPAVVLFTSGSEGLPKGVVLSHDSILANLAQIKAVIDFTNRDKMMNALPVFHSFGLTAGVLLPLLSGARVFLYPSPLHFRIIPELVYDRNCTALLGTPTFLDRYGRAAHPYDFYKVRYVVGGAEKLSEETRRLWQDKFGIRILEGYGATECSPVISVNTPFAHRPGSVGKFLPGIEWKVVPAPGIEEGGELHVRGDNVMLGYWRHTAPRKLEPPSSSLGPGWYATGDVVTVDEDGYLFIRDRLRRFAKVAGEMIPLEVTERIAAEVSPRYRSAATAVARPGRGDVIVLFTCDPEVDRSVLAGAAKRLGLPELALPRRIVHLDRLPLLATGKPDYVQLKAMAEKQMER